MLFWTWEPFLTQPNAEWKLESFSNPAQKKKGCYCKVQTPKFYFMIMEQTLLENPAKNLSALQENSLESSSPDVDLML